MSFFRRRGQRRDQSSPENQALSAELSGRRLPELMAVRSGDKEFGRFKITLASFGPPPATLPESEEKKTEAKPKTDSKPESKSETDNDE